MSGTRKNIDRETEIRDTRGQGRGSHRQFQGIPGGPHLGRSDWQDGRSRGIGVMLVAIAGTGQHLRYATP